MKGRNGFKLDLLLNMILECVTWLKQKNNVIIIDKKINRRILNILIFSFSFSRMKVRNFL
jgi:hypothetical protein